ncbi:DUF7426 family protein [Gordonia insulae]|uniref:DUF7426 domain-containing protein n=1 Tax=Gordonia insulae TaxID=2420509 RepID=A0A3G8JEI8_9ACTN|nr:hypothetical protein [Gordonia insulae]AZG43443.1 hypothetical protein D7316_00007 [Gordonia insulae]
MGFSDLREFLTPELALPINGQKYAVSPSADLVLRIRDYYTNPDLIGQSRDESQTLALQLGAEIYGATYDPDTKVITGDAGSAWEQMETDNVSGDQALRALQTALMWFGMSHEMAEKFWESGMIPLPNFSAPASETEQDPEPEKPNRATRRAAAKKAPAKKAGSKARAAGTTPAPAPSE